MKAVIIIAGYATRLEPRTKGGKIAKTLLPIKGDGKTQPIFYHLLDKIEAVNLYEDVFDEIIVITNDLYKSQIIEACEHYNSKIPMTVRSDGTKCKEKAIGANADLNFANSCISLDYEDDIMVLAGDNYFDLDLGTLIDYKRAYDAQGGGNTNIIVGKVYPKSKREFIADNFGILHFDGNNRLVELQEKPGIKKCKSDVASLALYIFNRQDFALLDEYLNIYADNKKMRDSLGFFIDFVIKHTNAYVFPYKGKFYDIGTPEEYDKLSGIKHLEK